MAEKRIYGTIDGSGKILSGKGFRCQVYHPGWYIINFDYPFSEQPTVVATVQWDFRSSSETQPVITRREFQYFECITQKPNGYPQESSFSFIAIGEG